MMINTHKNIDTQLSGTVIHLEDGKATVKLTTIAKMVADEMGLIHGGFIFSAADYAAMVAVNEPNVVLASSQCKFLAPVKVGEEVLLNASIIQDDGRKKIVLVQGFIQDKQVLEAEFKTVVTQQHVLTLS